MSTITGLVKPLNALRKKAEQFASLCEEHLFLLKKAWDGESKSLSTIILSVIVANLFYLANLTLSIDDEIHANYSAVPHWISVGRWTLAALNYFLFPQPVVPFVPYLVFSVCLGLGYWLLLKAHRIHIGWISYLSLFTFSTYPLWHLIAYFDSTVYGIGVGMALIGLCALLFSTSLYSDHRSILTYVIQMSSQVALLGFAVAAYQSFVFMYLIVGAGIVLINIFNGVDLHARNLLKGLLQIVIVSTLAVLVQTSVAAFIQKLTNIPPSSYLDTFYGDQLNWWERLGLLVSEAKAYYTGDRSKFGVPFTSSFMLFIMASLFIAYRAIFQRQRSTIRRLTLIFSWLFVLTTPFLMILIFSNPPPARTLWPLAYVFWLMSVILLQTRTLLARTLASLLIVLFGLQSVYINNLYNAKAIIANQFDRALAADIYSRLGMVDPTFDRAKPAMVSFYGQARFILPAYSSHWSTTVVASSYDWNSAGRIVSYMRLMGCQNLSLLPDTQRVELADEFDKMPAWPADGFIKKVNDVFLIKLSNEPDGFHARLEAKSKSNK